MNYVLVNAFEDPIRAYHQSLVDAVAGEFPSLTRTKEQGFPAHFTLKYPFAATDISKFEDILAEFAKTHNRVSVKVGALDHFEDRTVFAQVDASQEARALFAESIYEIKKIPWMQWDQSDGSDMHFHMTVAQPYGGLYRKVLDFLKGKERHFDSNFSNIAIFQSNGVTPNGVGLWKLYKQFEMRQSEPCRDV